MEQEQTHHVLYLNPFMRMETYVLSADIARIKFVNEKSLNYILFEKRELEDILMQIRIRIEPNIPHPFKFHNLYKRDFNLNLSLPSKIRITHRGKSFAFDAEAIHKLYEIEDMLYGYQSC